MKYKIRVTDKLKDWVGAKVKYPLIPKYGTCVILVRPKYIERGDRGIINHELVHVKQYSNNFFHQIKNYWSKTYRYECELEAYKEQIKEYNYTSINQAEWIIQALMEKYNLDVSLARVHYDIKEIINNLKA